MELNPAARRVLAQRAYSLSINDLAMVRECDSQLARWGISIEEVERGLEKPEKAVTEKRTTKTSVKQLSETASK